MDLGWRRRRMLAAGGTESADETLGQNQVKGGRDLMVGNAEVAQNCDDAGRIAGVKSTEKGVTAVGGIQRRTGRGLIPHFTHEYEIRIEPKKSLYPFGEIEALRRILAGVSCAAVGLLISVVLRMMVPLVRKRDVVGLVVLLAVFVAIGLLRLPLWAVLLVATPISIAIAFVMRRRVAA